VKKAAIAAAALLSVGVIAAAHGAASAVTPTHGYFEAHLGGNKYLKFGVYDYRFLQVDGMSIEERFPSSLIINGFDGYALVVQGRFNYGSKRGQLLLANGEWTSNDVVKGTVTLPDGTRKDFHATRIVYSGGGGYNLPPAADGVHPAAGHYRAPFHGGTHVEFSYHDSHVTNFHAAGHSYFTTTPVHDGAFTWVNPEHHTARVIGHWTTAHNVVGEVIDQHGLAWEFDAKLQ
jgi:hypothetical protein